jgi:hypothetical protein
VRNRGQVPQPSDRQEQLVGSGADDIFVSFVDSLASHLDDHEENAAKLAARAYDWSLEDHETITSMRARLRREGRQFLDQVREVCDQGRLDETFVDALCEPVEIFTYGGMIAHLLTFAACRRTLVVGALDRYGIPDLGWGDPIRWVAPAVG